MLSSADVNPRISATASVRPDFTARSEFSVRMKPQSQSAAPSKVLPIISWVAMLVGGALVGVIIAYIDRGTTTEKYATHYQYLIRTFWIGLLFLLVSFVLSLLLVGFFLMMATGLWYVIRCVKGLVLVIRDEQIDNPSTWLV